MLGEDAGFRVMLGPRVRVKVLWSFIKPTCDLGARGGKLQKKNPKGLLKNQFITQLKLKEILWDQERPFSLCQILSQILCSSWSPSQKKKNPVLGMPSSMEVWVAKGLLLRHCEGLSSDFLESEEFAIESNPWISSPSRLIPSTSHWNEMGHQWTGRRKNLL